MKPRSAAPEGWQYRSITDQMDGRTMQVGCVEAIEELVAKPPHSNARPELCISAVDTFANVSLHMNGAGQVVCHDCTVRTKVDTQEPVRISAKDDGNGGIDVLYLQDEAWLLNGIRAGAKRVAVEPELYQAGYPVIWFDVAGLNFAKLDLPEKDTPMPTP